MNKSVTQVLLLAAVLCAALAPARAAIQAPCSNAIVLPGPNVDVFILPVRAESKLTQRGRELATVVQRHVLFAALKYQSIAVAELTGDAEDCRYELIAPRILSTMRKGQAAVFLWARMFEQDDAIRLQSTVSFSVVGSPDTYEWPLGEGETATARSSVPAEPVRFSARKIPLDFLQMLEGAQRESRRLHASPDSASPAQELPSDPQARFGFEVTGTQNDWMQVRVFPTGETGWIPAHALADGSILKGAFPELYFVDGLIGYYQLKNRAARGGDDAGTRRLLEATRGSFNRYLDQAEGRAESDARALAAIFKGNATLRAATLPWSTAVLQAAAADFRLAQRQAPASTTATSFALACTSALCARGACDVGGNQLHTQYLGAIARDPTSAELVSNLNAFYAVAEKGGVKIDLSPEQISKQRSVTRRLQDTMR